MKTDTTAAEAAKGALLLGTIGSILWKPDPHAQLHFWRTGGSEFAMMGVDPKHAARRDVNPPLAPHRPRPILETEEWLFESATEFIEALEKYYAERATQIKIKNN